MYYLLLELPAFRQLTVTRGEWARGIEKSFDSLFLRHQVEVVEVVEDFRLFRYPPVRQDNLQELLLFLSEMQEILEEIRDDLLGYTLLLDRSETRETKELLRELKERVFPVALDDGLWFTKAAAAQLRGLCELGREEGSLYRVEEILQSVPIEGRTLLEAVEAVPGSAELGDLLDALGNRHDGPRSLLLLQDDTGGLLRWALRLALEGSRRSCWIEAEPGSLANGRLWLPGIPAIGGAGLIPAQEERIRELENQCANFVYADRERSYRDRPEEQLKNLWYEAIVIARSLVSVPLFVCFDVHRWGPEEITSLQERLEEADPEGRVAVVGISRGEAPLFSSLGEEDAERIVWNSGDGTHYEDVLLQRAGAGEGDTPMARLFATYEERELLLLFLLRQYGAHLSPGRLELLAGRIGLSPVEYRRSIERLRGDGVLWARPDGAFLVTEGVDDQLGSRLEVAGKHRVSRILGTELLHLHEQGELEERPELFTAMLFAAGQGEQERLLRDYLWDRLPLYEGESVERWLFGFEAERRDRLFRLSEIFRWRAELCSSGRVDPLPPQEGAGGLLEAEQSLAVAEGYYIEGLLQKSLHISKRALAQFMQLGDNHGRARAYVQLALVAMGRGELGDATAYLGYGVESARAAHRADLQLTAEALRGVVSFGYGNLSRVVQESPELSRRAGRLGASRWELFAHFLYGRALLELGSFEEAERAFAAVHSHAAALNEREAERAVMRWMARSRWLRGEAGEESYPAGGLLESADPELSLFRLERSFFAEESAPPALRGKELAHRTAIGFHPLYRLSWKSGFSSVEDLIDISGRRTLELFSVALVAWFQGVGGETKSARERLRWLTREERQSRFDPNKSIYLYLYSAILPYETEAETDDRRTVLGKSIKLLQERTARLDRSGDKERYSHKNRWNQLLLREAKLLNML